VQDAMAGPYAGAPADGSAREGGPSDARVLRGGTWRYGLLPFLRVSYRNADSPEARDAFNGFRCLRDGGWR
jgi:formylglycine-generating enzyme required for sulfatase activity